MKYIYMFDEMSRASTYGIGTYLNQICVSMSKTRNISFNLIKLRSNQREFTYEKRDGYNVFTIPDNEIHSSEFPERYYHHIWYLIFPYVELSKDDSLIFHLNYPSSYSLIALMKQYYPECKVVYTIHFQSWAFSLNGNVSYFKKIYNTDSLLLNEKELKDKYTMEKECKIYNDVDRIICLSEFTRKFLQENYNIASNKLLLILNGLKDSYNLDSIDSILKLKMKYQIDIKQKNILFVGRLDQIKGIDYLIKAFKLVLEKMPNSHLYIIGDGDFSSYYKEIEMYWSKITFTGRLDQNILYDFYKIADVGVMPSLHEQCSYVAIEMLMFDIPLLISTTTGLCEMIEGVEKIEIEECESSIYISIEEMAKNIMLLLDKPHTLKYRDIYLRKYGEGIFLKKMEEFYNSLDC